MVSRMGNTMPAARKMDPFTSHEAAASIMNYTRVQMLIMGLFDSCDGGYTDEELIRAYNNAYGQYLPASDSSIRSRRAELRDRNDVRDSGHTRLTRLGHKSVVWMSAGRMF